MLIRTQFHFPYIKSYCTAFQATKAAYIFMKSNKQDDYKLALPNLIKFYRDIRYTSNETFDDVLTAQFELKWWIVHRQRDRHTREDLEDALAATMAELYNVPFESLKEYARLRSEAMFIRDNSAANKSVTELDWSRINSLLLDSWRSLWNSLHQS